VAFEIRQCVYCGEEYKARSKWQKYCCEECRDAARTNPARLSYTRNYWLLGNIPLSVRERVLERDGHRCYICGRTKNLHLHHIIPRSQGGPHTEDNLITLCSGCHRSVESGDLEKAVRNCVRRAIANV